MRFLCHVGTKLKEICTMNEEMMKFIDEWLDYGYWNGLGQWNNSGKGRFTYEVL